MGWIMPVKHKPTMFGITFASADECGRYLELREKQAFGDIKDLEYEPETFEIKVKSKATGKMETICKYTPDFRYTVVSTGEVVYEDVKSLRITKQRGQNGRLITKKYGTAEERDWKLKKKMMLHIMGIDVREVLMGRSVRSMLKEGYKAPR